MHRTYAEYLKQFMVDELKSGDHWRRQAAVVAVFGSMDPEVMLARLCEMHPDEADYLAGELRLCVDQCIELADDWSMHGFDVDVRPVRAVAMTITPQDAAKLIDFHFSDEDYDGLPDHRAEGSCTLLSYDDWSAARFRFNAAGAWSEWWHGISAERKRQALVTLFDGLDFGTVSRVMLGVEAELDDEYDFDRLVNPQHKYHRLATTLIESVANLEPNVKLMAEKVTRLFSPWNFTDLDIYTSMTIDDGLFDKVEIGD